MSTEITKEIPDLREYYDDGSFGKQVLLLIADEHGIQLKIRPQEPPHATADATVFLGPCQIAEIERLIKAYREYCVCSPVSCSLDLTYTSRR